MFAFFSSLNSAQIIMLVAVIVLITAIISIVTIFFIVKINKLFKLNQSTKQKEKLAFSRFLIVLSALLLYAISIITLFAIIKHYYEGIDKDKLQNIIVPLVIILLLSISAAIVTVMRGKESKNIYFNSKNITRIAVFASLSYVLYMFAKFSLPFMFPAFLDVQISNMPALLAGFMMGPIAGIVVVVMKIALKLPFSTTGCVGELADLIIGIVYVLASSFIYRKFRSKKGAIVSLTVGSLVATAAAMLINRYILVDFYISFYGLGDVNGLINALGLNKLYKGINSSNFYAYYIFVAILPFNILNCLLCSLVTFLVYKRLERIFKKMFGENKKTGRQINEQADSLDKNLKA